MFRFLKSKKGFTLVELMIVVVIMAILVAVAVPIYSAVTANARKKTCIGNQREIVSQINNHVMTAPEVVALADSSTATIRINTNANGDGVDSNGTVEFAGGTTIIYGPTNGANGSLDADRGILVNGGTLIVVGPMGMIETPANNSKQCCVCYAVSGTANSKLLVKDDKGNVLFETTTPKQYQSVVISIPEFTIGNTYSIETGTTTQTFKLEAILTNAIGGGMGPGGSRPGPGGRPPRK